jgi:hypothetical protein
MTTDNPKPYREFGIEFIFALLSFLYPYGADQMGLPHNFSVGVVCWLVGTGVVVRMVWNSPLWNLKLTILEKSLISFIVVAAIVLLAYRPIVNAYHPHAPSDESAHSSSLLNRSLHPIHSQLLLKQNQTHLLARLRLSRRAAETAAR